MIPDEPNLCPSHPFTVSAQVGQHTQMTFTGTTETAPLATVVVLVVALAVPLALTGSPIGWIVIGVLVGSGLLLAGWDNSLPRGRSRTAYAPGGTIDLVSDEADHGDA